MKRTPDPAPIPRRPMGPGRARLAAQPHGVYRFRIGIFEAAIVPDGPLTLPGAPTIFPDLPAEVVAAALHEAYLPADAVRVEQNCVLLDVGGHLVLIDNGMGASTLFGTEAGRLVANLAAAGVTPAQIDSLVLTHAHPDHCWGTMRDDGTPWFPNAQIFLSASEWAYWTGPRRGADSLSAAGFRRHLWPLRDQVALIADGEEFLPGLHAVTTPGHTPGHMSIVIGSADEQAFLSGDLAFHHVLSFAHPGAASAYDADRALGAATRLRLLGLLAKERLRVLNYHAPWPGIGFVGRAGAAFRWCPEPIRFTTG